MADRRSAGGTVSRAVVVGCGRAGSGWDEWDESGAPPRTHAGCYQRSELTELVGLCDVNPMRAIDAGQRRGVEPWTEVDEMLAEARPDIVSVCTPPEEHLPVVYAAIEAGVRVVLCEKPLAHTVEDAREIARLAEGSDTVVAVMHHRRWMGGLDLVRSLFDHVVDVATIEYCGGALNNGTHAIDLVRAVADCGYQELSFRGTDRFRVVLEDSRYRAEFYDDGRRLRVADSYDGAVVEVATDYEHARLRAIEQMARIAQGSGEVPTCTVHDGLRAVELAYEASITVRRTMLIRQRWVGCRTKRPDSRGTTCTRCL